MQSTLLSVVNYFSEQVFGYTILAKESSEKLAMIKAIEENLDRSNILTRKLLMTCDNSSARVISSKLNFSDELMTCLAEVGLSPHGVIQLYLNSFVLPGLNLSLVRDKEVFLSNSLRAVYDRLKISRSCLTINQYIEGLEKLEEGFKLLNNKNQD